MRLFPEEDFHNLNEEFNIEPMYAKMSKDEVFSVKLMSTRRPSCARYPWDRFAVGESFFKAVSKEDLDADKGRPALPPNLKRKGISWTTCRIYHPRKKQYGYMATRVK
jgi:hypothetical protein